MIKIKKLENSENLDLSSDEDLSIAVMNLISIEEHLFFTGGKTGKTHYYDLLYQIREMRKGLLKMLILDYEGEVWCISKHLLAASMRLMEVGTKYQSKGETEKACDFFKKSFDLYNLFWGLNLGLVKKGDLKEGDFSKDEKTTFVNNTDSKLPEKDEGFFPRMGKFLSGLVDCCKE